MAHHTNAARRHRLRHGLSASAVAAVLALALPAPGTGSPAVAAPAAPAEAQHVAAQGIPESGRLPYAEDDLMLRLYEVRHRLDLAGKGNDALSPFVNAAFVLVDPSGLADDTLNKLLKGPAPGAPPVIAWEVDAYDLRNYLPAQEAEHARKGKLDRLLLVGGLSFRESGSKWENKPGLHSETHILGELAKLRTAKAPLKELTWASDRLYCQDCREKTSSEARRFHAYDYDLTDEEVAQQNQRIATAKKITDTAKRTAELKKIEAEYTKIQDERARQAQAGLAKDLPRARDRYAQNKADEARYTGETNGVFGTPPPDCPGHTAHHAAFTTGRGLPQAAGRPCGEGDGTPSRGSGLVKALAHPGSVPGGIDFSTLELRHLADPGGKGLKYSFSAAPGGSGDGKDPATGVKAARESSDAFFVWLSLPASTFWVNLNPNEPDRVVDSALGRTDVGRVLLQADLQLKKTTAKLIHPDGDLGRQFWEQISGRCMSFRTWIVPGRAGVHEKDGQLYILDAPLTVKAESQYFGGARGAASCEERDKGAEARNEAVFRRLVLPEIEKAVNHAPEYAALRRVYLSRVAAEWYRERSRSSATTYGSLVDRGDITRWVTRTDWKPKDTFDAYVRSFRDGEFHVERTTRDGDYITTRTYIFGGVDFANVTLGKVDAAGAFRGQWTEMPRETALSAQTALAGAQDAHVWLGGDNTPPGAKGPATARRTAPAASPGGGGRDYHGWLPYVAAVCVLVATFVVRRQRHHR
ncbi:MULTISPECIES: hypothetical protein [Streptomyces]